MATLVQSKKRTSSAGLSARIAEALTDRLRQWQQAEQIEAAGKDAIARAEAELADAEELVRQSEYLQRLRARDQAAARLDAVRRETNAKLRRLRGKLNLAIPDELAEKFTMLNREITSRVRRIGNLPTPIMRISGRFNADNPAHLAELERANAVKSERNDCVRKLAVLGQRLNAIHERCDILAEYEDIKAQVPLIDRPSELE